MQTQGHKKHSKSYYKNIESAKLQIKTAEEDMKKMETEVKEFHSHMANSMAKLMKSFTDGFTALDKAKQDEPVQVALPQKPQAIVQVTSAAPKLSKKSTITKPTTTLAKTTASVRQTQKPQPNILAQTKIGSGNQSLQQAIDTLLAQSKAKQQQPAPVNADMFDDSTNVQIKQNAK
jgi:hypothetical protein